MLAIVWAIKKCSLYLQGMQKFEVIADYRPLPPILSGKGLQDIANARLQRLRECLTPYKFVSVWRQGKLHAIPDALSRYPVENSTEDNKTAERQVSTQISSMVNGHPHGDRRRVITFRGRDTVGSPNSIPARS